MSGQYSGGGGSESVRYTASRSQPPETAGHRFGRLKVVSGEVIPHGKKGMPHLLVECVTCGARAVKDRSSLRSGKAGCRKCGNPQTAPRWLLMRATSAKQRCSNPKDRAWERYGARGIRFNFGTPLAMAVWVQENLGLRKDLELDRIDNDGHYEPGNLRYRTRSQNQSNTRKTRTNAAMHAFRLAHPHIRYADETLKKLLRSGMTWQAVIDRYAAKSNKPKGVYGTSSTPDPDIASLRKGS